MGLPIGQIAESDQSGSISQIRAGSSKSVWLQGVSIAKGADGPPKSNKLKPRAFVS